MSLAEKLKLKTKELKQTKEIEQKTAQEKELEPIRAHITEIEEKKRQLVLIKNSLVLKSGGEIGKGMKEYGAEVPENIKKETRRLDTLMDEHKEVLKTMGVENRDQLVGNEEFSGESEVVAYKGAMQEGENLVSADATLKTRLSEFGVNLPAEFSYDDAEKALVEKIHSLDEELILEKLKTPEGKAEAVGKISEELRSKIPGVEFTKTKDKTEINIGSQYRKGTIVISGETVKFSGWKNIELIPEEFGKVEKKYGAEIGNSALKEAYGKNVDRVFENFDENGENINLLLKGLEPADPKLAVEAKKALENFKAVGGEAFKNTIKEKIKQLEKQGLRAGSGDFYDGVDTISRLTEHKDGEGKIQDLIDNPTTFPPKFDWMNLKLKLEKRTEQNKNLLDALDSIKTQEQLNHLMTWDSNDRKDGTIGKMHWDTIHQQKFFDKVEKWNRDEGVVDATFHLPGDEHDHKLNALAGKFTHYGDAVQYLQERSKIIETEKKKIKEKINIGIDAVLTQRELQKLMKEENLYGSVEDATKSLERQKESGLRVLSELAKLEQALPKGEQITLNGAELEIPSIGEEIDELKQKIKTKQEEIATLQTKINQDKKPLFGKEKWQIAHNKLLEDQKELAATIKTMENNEMRVLTNKTWRLTSSLKEAIGNMSSTKIFSDIIWKQKKTGTSSEIFDDARKEIENVLNQKLPESITKKYNEYKMLENQLN